MNNRKWFCFATFYALGAGTEYATLTVKNNSVALVVVSIMATVLAGVLSAIFTLALN